MKCKYYTAGQIIYREESVEGAAYLIKRGKVKEYRLVEGREVAIATHGKGAVFGERAVLAKTKRDSNAMAIDNTEVLIFNSKNLSKLFRKSPPVTKVIISSLSKRIKSIGSAVQIIPEPPHFLAFSNFLAFLFEASRSGKIKKERALMEVKKVLNIPLYEIEQYLRKLAALQLISLVSAENGDQVLCCEDVANFISEAKAVFSKFEKAIYSSIKPMDKGDLASLPELAQECGIDQGFLLEMIADGRMPKEFYYFKRKKSLAPFE
jgi:CRP-like cAMP-binding protein